MENKEQIVTRYAERMNALFKNKGAKIIIYILAFLAINLFFGNLYYQSREITPDELTTQTITVDKIRHTKTETDGTRFWIVADKKEYDIHTDDLHQQHLTVNSFKEKVAEGDQLIISYFRLSPFSKRLVIAEAYNDNGVYLTIDGHNADLVEPRVMAIIFYFLATCLYSFIMIASEGWTMQWVRQRNSAVEAKGK